jgi:ribonuclease E
VHTRTPVALYILNQKRAHLRNIEERFGVSVSVAADDGLTGTTYHAIERGEPARGVVESLRAEPLRMDSMPPPLASDEEAADEDAVDEIEAGEERAAPNGREAGGDEEQQRRRRRRRGRGRGSDREAQFLPADAPQPPDDALGFVAASTAPQLGLDQPNEAELDDAVQDSTPGQRGDADPRNRRRSRRGGPGLRGNREGGSDRGRVGSQSDSADGQFDRGPGYWAYSEGSPEVGAADGAAVQGVAPTSGQDVPADIPAESVPAQPFPQELQEAPRESAQVEQPAALAAATEASIGGVQGTAEAEPTPRRRTPAPVPEHVVANQTVITQADPDRPKRGGWWQRAKATLTGEG